MKKLGILYKLILLMVTVVLASLLVTSVFMRQYIQTRETEVIKQRIQATARLVSASQRVIEGIKQQDKSGDLQDYAMQVMQKTAVDFVVIMDKNLTRYSHPTEALIGGTFSNVEDAGLTLSQGEHFSQATGTLGEGIRFFTPIYDETGQMIGVICVGYTQKTVGLQVEKAQLQLLTALCIGLLVAIILASLFAHWLKGVLLNLEPEEIAKSVIEKEMISEHITEGIIGIDTAKRIIVVNRSAKALFQKAQLASNLVIGEELSDDLYQLLFKGNVTDKQIGHDERVIVNDSEFLINRNPVYLGNKLYGSVVTLRDQSDMQQLITELSGTEKYNDSLRAQNHHFMNQMHVLQGLIDLQLFDEAAKYISYLKQDYHVKIGHISDNIKVPALTGLLLGKAREAVNQRIHLEIDQDSFAHQKDCYETLYHDLTIILGVLIDNAMEAVTTTVIKNIRVYLLINEDERIVLCEVEDTGVGMTESQQSKVFQRGYSTKGDNRGYGLDAVKAIVTRYNGVIEVKSQVDKGTTITLEIPMVEGLNESIDN